MKIKKHKILVAIFFVAYVILLAYVLFFAEIFGRGQWSEIYRYNFVPFKEIKMFWKARHTLPFYIVFLNLAGNVLAFVPFGFFLPMLVKGKKKRVGYHQGMTSDWKKAIVTIDIDPKASTYLAKGGKETKGTKKFKVSIDEFSGV